MMIASHEPRGPPSHQGLDHTCPAHYFWPGLQCRGRQGLKAETDRCHQRGLVQGAAHHHGDNSAGVEKQETSEEESKTFGSREGQCLDPNKTNHFRLVLLVDVLMWSQ